MLTLLTLLQEFQGEVTNSSIDSSEKIAILGFCPPDGPADGPAYGPADSLADCSASSQ